MIRAHRLRSADDFDGALQAFQAVTRLTVHRMPSNALFSLSGMLKVGESNLFVMPERSPAPRTYICGTECPRAPEPLYLYCPSAHRRRKYYICRAECPRGGKLLYSYCLRALKAQIIIMIVERTTWLPLVGNTPHPTPTPLK